MKYWIENNQTHRAFGTNLYAEAWLFAQFGDYTVTDRATCQTFVV